MRDGMCDRGLQCPRFVVKRAHTQAMIQAFCVAPTEGRVAVSMTFQDGQEPIRDVIDLDEDCDADRALRNRLREQARSVARRIAELRAARRRLRRPR